MEAPVPFGTPVRYHRQGESFASPADGEGVFLTCWPQWVPGEPEWTISEWCWSIRRTENSVVVLYPARGDTIEALVAVDA